MVEVLGEIEQPPLVVHTGPEMELDDERFFALCQRNRDLRIERNAHGDLIIMPPAGGSSSHGNAELVYLFQSWARRDRTGRIFDSSGGFILPNRATRSPDVSWVSDKRLEKLTDDEWKKFLPLCPDFVLELRSPSDPLPMLKEKMVEYLENGARLGWLIDPVRKHAHIYRPDLDPEVLDDPLELSGEGVLKGFVLELPELWAAMKRKARAK
jgi:Uma2 family endonuclease